MNHPHPNPASAEPGRYIVTGACRVDSTADPIRDAARALKSASASDFDTLMASGPEIPSFIAQSLHSILEPRPKVLRSAIEGQHRHP